MLVGSLGPGPPAPTPLKSGPESNAVGLSSGSFSIVTSIFTG